MSEDLLQTHLGVDCTDHASGKHLPASTSSCLSRTPRPSYPALKSGRRTYRCDVVHLLCGQPQDDLLEIACRHGRVARRRSRWFVPCPSPSRVHHALSSVILHRTTRRSGLNATTVYTPSPIFPPFQTTHSSKSAPRRVREVARPSALALGPVPIVPCAACSDLLRKEQQH